MSPEILLVITISSLLVNGVILASYLPRIYRVSNVYKEASEIVRAIVKELRDRQDQQDLKIADQLVRMETLEVQLHRRNFLFPTSRKVSLSSETPVGDLPRSRNQEPNARPDVPKDVSHISRMSHHISGNARLASPTATEAEVLSILREKPLTAREIQRAIGKSREHTARVLKRLYDLDYLNRKESQRPYVYGLRSQRERQ